MKKVLLAIVLLCGLATMVRGANPQGGLTDGQVIKLYQGQAPGSEHWKHQEVTFTSTSNPIVLNVVEPTM